MTDYNLTADCELRIASDGSAPLLYEGECNPAFCIICLANYVRPFFTTSFSTFLESFAGTQFFEFSTSFSFETSCSFPLTYTYYLSLCMDKIFVFSLSLIHPLLLNNVIYYESKEQLNFSFPTYTDFESRWGYWWSFEVSSTSFANYYSVGPWPPFFRISFSLTPRFFGSWPLNLVCELFSIELETKRRFIYIWVPP